VPPDYTTLIAEAKIDYITLIVEGAGLAEGAYPAGKAETRDAMEAAGRRLV